MSGTKQNPGETDDGIFTVGDEVAWDGEAESLGVDPFIWMPEPEPAEEDKDDPDGRDA